MSGATHGSTHPTKDKHFQPTKTDVGLASGLGHIGALSFGASMRTIA